MHLPIRAGAVDGKPLDPSVQEPWLMTTLCDGTWVTEDLLLAFFCLATPSKGVVNLLSVSKPHLMEWPSRRKLTPTESPVSWLAYHIHHFIKVGSWGIGHFPCHVLQPNQCQGRWRREWAFFLASSSWISANTLYSYLRPHIVVVITTHLGSQVICSYHLLFGSFGTCMHVKITKLTRLMLHPNLLYSPFDLHIQKSEEY